MVSPRTTAPISSSSSLSSRRQTTAGSPSPFVAATVTPAIPAPTSRPGIRSAPSRVAPTSSTLGTPSCARARTWTISIAPAGASSPYCHAVARRTKSFAGGSKPIRPSGPWCGTALILGSCLWTARPLVRLSRAIAYGRGLVDRLGVEHLAHLAPGGQEKKEHGRGQRGAQRVAGAARRTEDEAAARRGH